MADDIQFTGNASSLVNALTSAVDAQKRYMDSLIKTEAVSKESAIALRAFASVVKAEAEVVRESAQVSIAAHNAAGIAAKAASDEAIAAAKVAAAEVKANADKEMAITDLKKRKNDNYSKNLANKAKKDVELAKAGARAAEVASRDFAAAEQTKRKAMELSLVSLKAQKAKEVELLQASNRLKLEADKFDYKRQLEGIKQFNKEQLASKKGLESMLSGWKGLARIMAVSLSYRAFYGLIRQIQEGAQAALDFQREVAAVRTISQEAGMSANEWADGLQRVSDGWRLDIIEQTKAAYQALTNQVVDGRDAFAFLETANRFATAALVDTEEAVRLVTAAINAYGLQASDSERLFESFFKTIELGRIRGSDMTEMGRIFLPARTLGVEINELNAAMATLTRQGVEPGEAMMFLRNIMMALIKPTEAMQGYFDELGVSTGQAAIATFGYVGFLRQMEDRFKGSSSELGELFGRIRALTGAFGQQGSALELLEDTYKKLTTDTDNYNEAVKTMTTTSSEKLAIALSKIKNIFIRMGSDATDALSDMTGGFELLYIAGKELARFLRAALVPALVAAGSAAIWFGAPSAAAFGAAFLATPIGWITTALAAITTAIYAIASAYERTLDTVRASIAEELRLHRDRQLELDKIASRQEEKAERQRSLEFRVVSKRLADQLAMYNRVAAGQEKAAEAAGERMEGISKSIKDAFSDAVKAADTEAKRLGDMIDTALKDTALLDPRHDQTLFNWELEAKVGGAKLDFIADRLAAIREDAAHAALMGDYPRLKQFQGEMSRMVDLQRSIQQQFQQDNAKTLERQQDLAKKRLDLEHKYQADRIKLVQGFAGKSHEETMRAQAELQALDAEHARAIQDLQAEVGGLRTIEFKVTDTFEARREILKDIILQNMKLVEVAAAEHEREKQRAFDLLLAQSKAERLMKSIDGLTLKDIFTEDYSAEQLITLLNKQSDAYRDLLEVSRENNIPIDEQGLYNELLDNQIAAKQRLEQLAVQQEQAELSAMKTLLDKERQLAAEQQGKIKTQIDGIRRLATEAKLAARVLEDLVPTYPSSEADKKINGASAGLNAVIRNLADVDVSNLRVSMNGLRESVGDSADAIVAVSDASELLRTLNPSGYAGLADTLMALSAALTEAYPERAMRQYKEAAERLKIIESERQMMLADYSGLWQSEIKELANVESKLTAIKNLEQQIYGIRNHPELPRLRPLREPGVQGGTDPGDIRQVNVEINLNSTGDARQDARAIHAELQTLTRRGL